MCDALKLDALEELPRKRPDLHAKLLLAVGHDLRELLARATAESQTLETCSRWITAPLMPVH
ncbi:hypothetical protein [Derxia gummosa]|uniref:Uncharacterized protein n=1 Tax=Derxia gummosa DSM 723 TaxID=1121388 RepID=A0A8B6X7L6_9BURK|nr:hypothetical protein [Derxia gummosa]